MFSVIASSDLSERGNLGLRLLRRFTPRNDKKRENLQSETNNQLLITYYSSLFLNVHWLLTTNFYLLFS